MIPGDKAHEIVKTFQEEGHPYYDELLQPIETAIREAIQAEREACLQIALDEIAARRVGDAKTDDDAFYLMGGVAAGIKIGNRISARSEGEPGDR